jgi:hypothetical protein
MSQDLFSGSRLLSKPTTTQDTKVEVLRRFINREHGIHLSGYSRFGHTAGPYRTAEDYSELHKYSVTNYAFWLDLWRFLGIISSVPPTKVRSLSTASQRIHTHSPVGPGRGKHQRGSSMVSRRTFELRGEHVVAHRRRDRNNGDK